MPFSSPGVGQTTALPRRRLFYGWVIVASCLVISAALFGIRYSFGVFFTSLEAEFGGSRATTSALYSTYLFLAAFVAMFGGWATDRYGPKFVIAIMGAITGLSLFLSGLAQSMWQLYFAYSFLLALGTGGAYTVLVSTVSRWFVRNRGTALGIIGSGAGVGTLVLAPVSAWLISTYDWRTAYEVTAAIAIVFVLPMALLLKRSAVEIGLQPDGDSVVLAPQSVRVAHGEFSIAAVLRNRNFWLLLLTFAGYSYCLHVVMAHLVPREQDLGISAVQAASILGGLSAVSAPARILGGRLSDVLSKRSVGIACALLHAAAMLWLMFSTQTWQFYVFIVAYGIAYGGIDPPVSALIPEVFGLSNVGAIYGLVVVGWGVGAGLGPYLSGLIFDVTGSYQFAFLSGALIMVPTALCIYLVRGRQAPRPGATSG